MSSNYPPGVTGMEPEITGAFEVNPHAPFVVAEDNALDGPWCVFYGDPDKDRGVAFGPFFSAQFAESRADILNKQYRYRDHDVDKNGQCRICGDLIMESAA